MKLNDIDHENHKSAECYDYLANMCLAHPGFACAECNSPYWGEVAAITCFITHVADFQGDIERIPNNNKQVLEETLYHLHLALENVGTDFDNATSVQLSTLHFLKTRLIKALEQHKD